MTQDSLIFGKIYTVLDHSNTLIYKLLYSKVDNIYLIYFKGEILKKYKFYKSFKKAVDKLIKNRPLHEQN